MKTLLSIIISTFWLFGCSTSQQEQKQVATPSQPNILFIVADDLGYEQLGCYGGVGVETPHLDRMAEQGMRFTSAYASPVCTPSRMSIYTGTYVPRHGHTTVLPVHLGTQEAVNFDSIPTYAQQLRQAGYATSVTGKWQLAALEYHPQHCQTAGYDSWCVWQIWKQGAKTTRYWNHTYNQDGKIRQDPDSVYGPDLMTDYVIGQMSKAKEADKPFCIQHNMVLPHVPILPTPDDKNLERAPSLKNMVTYMDKQVGRLLHAVDSLGLSEKTLVLFIGDNGTDVRTPRQTLSGMLQGGKRTLNEGGTHIPLIARWNGTVAAGTTAEGLVEVSDFFPTFCEISGAKLPKNSPIDGISFVPQLRGEAAKREYVTAGIYDDFFVFDGQWRLHHEENRLYDCRDVLQEVVASPDSSQEAKAAYDQLIPILEELRAMRPKNDVL